ncbi:AraC family transcriptional regulator [Bacillus sp. SLBN-46]
MVGYKNPKQFTRVFREIEGVSPTEYREQKMYR